MFEPLLSQLEPVHLAVILLTGAISAGVIGFMPLLVRKSS